MAGSGGRRKRGPRCVGLEGRSFLHLASADWYTRPGLIGVPSQCGCKPATPARTHHHTESRPSVMGSPAYRESQAQVRRPKPNLRGEPVAGTSNYASMLIVEPEFADFLYEALAVTKICRLTNHRAAVKR